ncbi:putative membrane protein [Pseudomonas syringae]|nr:putative membrane protein [Pseudomonas syringae]
MHRSTVAAFRARYQGSFLAPIFMGIFSLAITAGTVADAYFPNDLERAGQSMMLMMGATLVLSFGGIMMSRGHPCGMWILAAILAGCFLAVLPTAPAHWRRFELMFYVLGLLFPLLGLLSLNSKRGRELRMQWRIIRAERKEIRQEMQRRKNLEKHRENLRKRNALRK